MWLKLSPSLALNKIRHFSKVSSEPVVSFAILISNYYANVARYDKIDSTVLYYCIKRRRLDSFLIIYFLITFIFNYIDDISSFNLYFVNTTKMFSLTIQFLIKN